MDAKSEEEMEITPSQEESILSSPSKSIQLESSSILRAPILNVNNSTQMNADVIVTADTQRDAINGNNNNIVDQRTAALSAQNASDAHANGNANTSAGALPNNTQHTDIIGLAAMIGTSLSNQSQQLNPNQLQSVLQTNIAKFFEQLNDQKTQDNTSNEYRYANIGNQTQSNSLLYQQRANNTAATDKKKKKKRGGAKVRERIQRAIDRDNANKSDGMDANKTGNQNQTMPLSIASSSNGNSVPNERQLEKRLIREIASRSTPVKPQQRLQLIKQTGDLPLQRVNSPNANKRNRTKGGTPPEVAQQSKKPHNTKQQQNQERQQHRQQQPHERPAQQSTIEPAKTTASIVKDANLVVAIVDMPFDGFVRAMDQKQYGILYDAINNMMFSAMASGSGMPTYEENRHTQGVMRMTCATQAAKAWLQMAIPYVTKLWEGMALKVIPFDHLPKPKKILGFFKNCNAPNELILKMLKAQNLCAWTDRWSIINRTNTPKGASITFGIDEEQLASLASCNFSLHFAAGTALFRDISKRSDANQPEIATTNSATGNVVAGVMNQQLQAAKNIQTSTATNISAANQMVINTDDKDDIDIMTDDTSNLSNSVKNITGSTAGDTSQTDK